MKLERKRGKKFGIFIFKMYFLLIQLSSTAKIRNISLLCKFLGFSFGFSKEKC